MKIFITNKETTALKEILEQMVIGGKSIASVLNTEIDSIDIANITSEDIDNFNTDLKGVAVITKETDGYSLEVSEEFIVDTCDVCRDFVIDFSDIIKYAFKTLKSFAILTLKPFSEKWQNVLEKNKQKDSTTAH